MDYVMVPVPEELAEKVLTYVSWKGPPSAVTKQDADNDAQRTSDQPDAGDSDDRPLGRVVARLDAASRRLLTIAATAALDQEPLTVAEAARRVGLGVREVLGIIVEVNTLLVAEGEAPIAANVTAREGVDSGEFSWDTRVVVMPEPVAQDLVGLTQTVHDE